MRNVETTKILAQSDPFVGGYLVGFIVCGNGDAAFTRSRRGGTGRRAHGLSKSSNTLRIIVEVEACKRSVQVVDSVLPIELATPRG